MGGEDDEVSLRCLTRAASGAYKWRESGWLKYKCGAQLGVCLYIGIIEGMGMDSREDGFRKEM